MTPLLPDTTDVLIVGSGIGGSTLAAGLAGSGAAVTILERGERLEDGPGVRDPHAIFVEGRFRPRRSGGTRKGQRSTPATTTMSAATRSSTAR